VPTLVVEKGHAWYTLHALFVTFFSVLQQFFFEIKSCDELLFLIVARSYNQVGPASAGM